ncbi:tudor domain-containing protein 1 isoform X2 [Erythrolamprus reginae]|uniref:tudor domain-containing protein 1 isoform X2 n=1 Tax=Erythrolamprus reginae TaxID=121349 RepID=UPI00396C8F40
MEQRLQIKVLTSPNESLRSPSTTPNFKNTVLVDDKVPPLLNNFSICEQAKLFFANMNGSVENSHVGSDHKSVSLNMAPVGMKGNFKVVNNVLSSTKKINPVSDSALIQAMPLSTSDKVLPISYNSQFGPLNPLYLPTCHFCGLFGTLRCIQCKQVCYCSRSCQMKDWQIHNIVCKPSTINTIKAEYCRESLDESNQKENILPVNSKNVEQGKKIMLSDLNNLGLKKNMTIKGTITDFNNPSEFYVQVSSPEVQSNIRKLTMKLKDYKGIKQEYTPIKGDVGVAKYSLDQTWCRVLIKEIDILTKSAQILYIDYGKRENILLHNIKGLHEDISQIPPCAIKCCVANIPDIKQWNENYKNIIASILIGKKCSLVITDVLVEDLPCFTVDAFLTDGKHLHEIILENIHDLNAEEKDSKKETSVMDHTVEKKSVLEKKVEWKELDHTDGLTPKMVSVSIGDTFLGMIAHIQNPGGFFCQQTENGCRLSQLQASLHEYCENTSITPDFCPAVGDVCCAQFTDNQWYRATVISLISEKIVLVGYIDYGNFEMLQLNRLRPIVQKLMELPMQAMNCTLAGVKPVSGTWTAEATFSMKQLVQNKVVAIKVNDKKMNTFVVDITDQSVTPSINLSKCLLELGYAVEEAPIILKQIETIKETNGEKQEPVNWSWVTLTAKQVVNVMVSVLYSPSKFYCQLLNKDDLNALKELNLSLAEYCEKTKPNVSQVIKGKVYGAYFSGDGKWYRVCVKDVISLEVIKVQFVDYGNYEEIPIDKIRQISSTFLKLPFQGIKCWLSGVRPKNNTWTTEAITTFQMHATEKKLQARVISLMKNSAEVELIDNSSSIPMISEILIRKHLAFKENLLLNPDTLPCTSTSMQWTMPVVPIGDTTSALVLDVVDPGLFYVIPNEMKVDLEKLKKLMIELADYCCAQNDSIFQPKVGEPCCARFSGDDKWYRALVLGINVSEVKVVYADYGNVEMLPFSQIRPITARYLQLPFQILKCSLAGIVGLDGKWSISAIEKLKSLLMNTRVIITVKEVTQNIYPVIVQKISENRVMDIAEQLIIENLAKHSNNGNQCSKTTDCCCIELKKQVAKLEQILYFLLKDRFGEYKHPDIIKPLEK